jgi:hypothetical protein
VLTVPAVVAAGLVVAPTPAGAVPPASFTLGSTQPASVYGQSVTLTASIAGGSGTPTGEVSFFDGASPLCLGDPLEELTPGVAFADCTIATLGVGTHSITATYSGDATYDPSESTTFQPAFTQTVAPASTTTALGDSPDPSVFTGPVELTATVTVTAPGGGAPGGDVEFLDGATPVAGCSARPVVAGEASCTVIGLSPGLHTLSAEYGGSVTHAASTSAPATHGVSPAETTTTVVADDASTTWHQAVLFTANVAPVPPASAAPSTGTVRFAAGGVTITGCSAQTVTTGTATCSTSDLPVGVHAITAEYGGGPEGYAGSTSPDTTQTVMPAPTSLVLTADEHPSVFGQPVTFTATAGSGAGTPAGDVAFFVVRDDLTRRWLATVPLASGVATTTTSGLAVGRHTIQAVYRGSPTFSAQTDTIEQSVRRAPTATTVTTNPDPSALRRRVTVKVKVTAAPPGGGTPTGSVAVFRMTGDDTRVWLGTVGLRSGRASVTTTTLPVGTYTIAAVYRGGRSHSAGSGATEHRVVPG